MMTIHAMQLDIIQQFTNTLSHRSLNQMLRLKLASLLRRLPRTHKLAQRLLQMDLTDLWKVMEGSRKMHLVKRVRMIFGTVLAVPRQRKTQHLGHRLLRRQGAVGVEVEVEVEWEERERKMRIGIIAGR
jgi:hypothetical protein